MVCELNIKVAHRAGNSFLKDAFLTPPFRIVPVGQYKKDKAAYLMIMSSSPGLLDGDTHNIEVDIAQGSKLQLQTQAYQRLFHMKGDSAQTMRVNLGQDATFSFVPHPVVPQNASSFRSHNIIHLQKNNHVLLSDIVTCGRKMSGESFQYHHFQSLTECFIEGKLVLKDNVLLQPDKMPIQGLGILEGYTHQGTLFYLNSAGVDVLSWIDKFHQQYGDREDLAFGISELQEKGFMVRVLGHGAEPMFDLFKDIQNQLWDALFLQ
ncbi:urease accessory protein UreD [Sphingobacterium psychroaquaticum]|uniref:Urease accessory protein UreD n=1 Tax=Sphingobacterium psychroaquaticum TaxID=561061 RepID=A0A1X7KDX1_9SPHI|nr:urease accessory protein UreD [Sphingobacterium psychroaquaticum]SMG39059.1 urease accessory protein [Sphingobacterium psychroaquaticum]